MKMILKLLNGEKIWRNVFYELDESIYDNLKNNKKSAVIFPIFTAAAYSEPGILYILSWRM